MGYFQGGFTKGVRTSSLLYIYIAIVQYMHGAFPATSGASGVKIWHSPRTGRDEQEEGKSGGGGRKPV
jgi:hypothetical protein